MVAAAPPLNALNTKLSLFESHKGAQITSEAALSFVVFVSRPTSADLEAISERASTSPFPVGTTMSAKDSDWTCVIMAPVESLIKTKLLVFVDPVINADRCSTRYKTKSGTRNSVTTINEC